MSAAQPTLPTVPSPAPPTARRPARFRLPGIQRPGLPRLGHRTWPSRHTLLVAGALGVVYVVWGSTFLALSVVVTAIPPLLAMAVRFVLAGLLLLVIARLRRPERPWHLRPAALGHSLLTGVLLLVGGTGLVAVAQTRISSGLAALLGATVPLFLALFARVALAEVLSARAGAGLLVGLAGIAVLVDPGGGQMPSILLALLGAELWAAGSIRSRRRRGPEDAVVGAAFEMLGAALVFALLAGVIAGPLTFLDVAAQSPQESQRWLSRAAFFTTIGMGMAALVSPSLPRFGDDVQRLRNARALREAIEDGELFVRFQPLVTMSSGALYGVEALVRWNHPRHGELTPAAFLHDAERSGAIRELDAFVFEQACRQAAHWST
ncbi:MAG: EAL domain-containing protein, partial [Nitriliruptoraceae bacterium]